MKEYTEQKEYVENRKPYWLNLRHPRRDEMRFELNNYFPDAHYRRAIKRAQEDQLVPDGGRYTETRYAWYDPDTDAFLYHTEANQEYTNPFFDTEEDAYTFLERRAEHNQPEYENLSLWKLRSKKVGEAVEVLTDQAGLTDFHG